MKKQGEIKDIVTIIITFIIISLDLKITATVSTPNDVILSNISLYSWHFDQCFEKFLFWYVIIKPRMFLTHNDPGHTRKRIIISLFSMTLLKVSIFKLICHKINDIFNPQRPRTPKSTQIYFRKSVFYSMKKEDVSSTLSLLRIPMFNEKQ